MGVEQRNIKDLLMLEGLTQNFQLLPKRRIHGIMAGKHASVLRGRGMDFSEVRNYVSGDDIRNIDWKVTARTGKAHTKIFSEEKEIPQLILVDQSSNLKFGSQVDLKVNIALDVATINLFRALQMGDRVGILAFNNERSIYLKPTRNKRVIQGYIENMLELNHETLQGQYKEEINETFSSELDKISRMITSDYIVNVISDFSLVTHKNVDIMSKMSEHNNVIATHIVDLFDYELPLSKIVMSDGHSQIDWKVDEKSSSSFHDSYQGTIENLEKKLLSLNIPMIKFNTATPIQGQIKTLISERS